MADSLRNKAVKGVGWSFADNLSNQGITFLVGLVLARLLTPAEYGLIGIILIFVAVFNSIVDGGLSNALIRKPDADEKDLNTVFYSNLAVSVLLCAAMYGSAVWVGAFFDQPTLVGLTRAMSVIVVVNALALVQRAVLVKRIDFKTQTKVSLIANLTSGGVGIAMAVYGCGVWSLVGQQLSRSLLTTLLLWVFSRWTPSWLFSWRSFRELVGYGWKLLLSTLIDTIWKEINQVVIGKCYSPQALGQYTRAYQFSSICSSNLTSVVQRVSFPTLSAMQDQPEQLGAAYRKVIRVTMLVTFVAMLSLAAVAEPLIRVLVGDQWLPAVPMLQLLCFSMMLYPLHALNLNMLQVQGRSDLFLWLEIVKKTIAIGPLLLGIFVGIHWMLVGGIATSVISYWLNAFYSGRMIGYSFARQVRDIFPSFVVALVVGAAIYPLTLLGWSPFVVLPLQLLAAFVLAWGICEWSQLDEYLEIKHIIQTIITRFGHGK